MYTVRFTDEAKKQFDKLDRRYHSAVAKALNRISQDPKLGEPLQRELKGYWKLRFSRYRIIYKINNKKLLIIVFDIDHRKEVYR